jgi:hypothetical protein
MGAAEAEWEQAGPFRIRKGGCVDLRRDPPLDANGRPVGLPYMLHCTGAEWGEFVTAIREGRVS